MKNRKSARHLEQHHYAHELKPIGKYNHNGIEYALALGGPYRIDYPITELQHAIRKDHGNGFYEFAWVIFKGETPWIEGTNLIDINHDSNDSNREQLRINAAHNAAHQVIDQLKPFFDGRNGTKN